MSFPYVSLRSLSHSLPACLAAGVLLTSSSPAWAAASEEAGSFDIRISQGVLHISPHIPGRASGLFKIENTGSSDQLLQGISSPYCTKVTANHSDLDMEEDASDEQNIFRHLVIPQHSVMVFPQTGYHIWCRHIDKPINAGDAVPFYFHFIHNQTVKADLIAKDGSYNPATSDNSVIDDNNITD